MLIIYDSRTGNVERFINKLELSHVQKIKEELKVNEDFILITYTTGFGQVPETTTTFLNNNSEHLKAVAVSGNRNWGMSYGKAGDTISQQYEVPLLLKFELSGTKKDINTITQEVLRFDRNATEMD
ncbi:ribonucleotide reductase assembly protein NrdI [Priestia filamentosa]|uniref:Protein NrdI n=1 Tax=Priestia filamentosa TaxID=1402861 RepID=A0A0H4KUQ8_9BACI|nr:class Ib ribonucleoside-diphosphate reductase assembly flavoprotein NrdI [Priestia filamentosa]AKO92038.1 ribonucleotide reductase assembly protein NrdI [Priestia filamentosa]